MADTQATGPVTGQLVIRDGDGTTPVKIVIPKTLSSPLGSVVQYLGQTAPAGWILADGNSFDQSVYSDLYNLLGSNVTPTAKSLGITGTAIIKAV